MTPVIPPIIVEKIRDNWSRLMARERGEKLEYSVTTRQGSRSDAASGPGLQGYSTLLEGPEAR